MALLVLVYGLWGVLLFFAQAVVIPIALAVLFALVLSSPVEALHRKGLPRSVSAVLILLIFLGAIGLAVDQLWAPADQWLAGAPHTVKIISQKLGPMVRVLHRIDAITDRAGHLTDTAGSSPPVSAKEAPTPSASGGLLLETRTALVATMTVIILTLFFLAGGPPMLARMTVALARDVHSTHVLRVIDAVRSEVGRYYATITLINVGLALATGFAMMLLGMPNPILWGVLAGTLNFIPYVGSAATLVVLTVVAFVSFDSVGRVVAVAATYLGLATLEGQVVQPLFVGHRLDLSPIIVFLALWIGGWFWGIAGVVMAVPTLVALKVVAEHSEHGQPLLEFLSPNFARRFKPRLAKFGRAVEETFG
ncbi:MAG TPA: AI-2E family transporter [Steroidobacteraceae bacterium]|jgi:predicted PurR-regulated permease PerM|nr:AI-2E family transporter [Steroidobacteraceae bacterium]